MRVPVDSSGDSWRRMTIGFAVIVVLCLAFAPRSCSSEDPQLAASFAKADAPKSQEMIRIEEPSQRPQRRVVRIHGNEAAVNGKIVKRVDIGANTVSITYLNTTQDSIRPDLGFRLVDSYGIAIAFFDARWTFQSIKPGETQTENKNFNTVPIWSVLEFSNIQLPSDWAGAVYLIINGEIT